MLNLIDEETWETRYKPLNSPMVLVFYDKDYFKTRIFMNMMARLAETYKIITFLGFDMDMCKILCKKWKIIYPLTTLFRWDGFTKIYIYEFRPRLVKNRIESFVKKINATNKEEIFREETRPKSKSNPAILKFIGIL